MNRYETSLPERIKYGLGDFAQTVGAYIHLPPRGQFHSSVRKQTALGYDSIIHKFLQLSTYSGLLIFCYYIM